MMKAGFLTMVGLILWAPYALAVPGGLSSIAEKAREIETLCTVVAGIIVGIGAVWCGVKFVKGDPDSWGYVWKFGLGAILIFSAPQVVAWLSGGA
ncbi:MAG TPA: TrbC/VirB2 family protein [Verrucomicrobiota bacterium]|nr:TrbC/VirB2 family protein [Verrucomicrobiota bacterium]